MANNKKTKPSKMAQDGRKTNGQFATGHSLGGSAPYSKVDREWKAEVMAVFRKVVTHERLEKQLERLAQKADSGNLDALKFELGYLYGKPKETVEISGADGDAIKVDIGGNLSDEEIKRIAGAVSAGCGAVK